VSLFCFVYPDYNFIFHLCCSCLSIIVFFIVIVILDLVFRFVAVVVISSLFLFCFIAVVVVNPDTSLFNNVIFSVQFLVRFYASFVLYLSIQVLNVCIIGAVSLSSTWFIVSLMLFYCLSSSILGYSLISVISIYPDCDEFYRSI